ncbi:hypothetical protein INP83_05070 [Mucilaginibacter sp. 21P]|uniref:hypothetical protein n=1 Tax=Mucilaginibacter sp. 21P TaxID=2778902 RepID=UPI001C572C4A|nr:hypothetical protein [Mucilaginibacter sp. 21P]QXV66457.1 hypothetical protein INP83_05070 [Mucilaginibacter sp. 21P]
MVTVVINYPNFNSYLQNFVNRNYAAEILKRFIYYQIRQGFWNKSVVKQHNVDVEKLNEAQEELILVQKSLSENLQAFESLKKQINDRLNELTSIYEEKNTQSNEITGFRETANLDSSSITTLLTSATSKEREISGFVGTIKSKVNDVESDISNYQDAFENIKKQNKDLSDQLTQNLDDAIENLKTAKEGNEYITNQKETISKLIGLAADGSLGYKFDSRKSELQKGIKFFWRWAVPISVLIALIWVVVVFTKLSAHLGNEWINLLVNVVKTAPAWILVGFVFSQYGKERNLQEEYAFKSAIAMTLTSYSQMLSENDASDKKAKSSKQEMLLKSIENLYTQPILKNDKSENIKLLNSKELVDSLKALADMLKSMKN